MRRIPSPAECEYFLHCSDSREATTTASTTTTTTTADSICFRNTTCNSECWGVSPTCEELLPNPNDPLNTTYIQCQPVGDEGGGGWNDVVMPCQNYTFFEYDRQECWWDCQVEQELQSIFNRLNIPPCLHPDPCYSVEFEDMDDCHMYRYCYKDPIYGYEEWRVCREPCPFYDTDHGQFQYVFRQASRACVEPDVAGTCYTKKLDEQHNGRVPLKPLQ